MCWIKWIVQSNHFPKISSHILISLINYNSKLSVLVSMNKQNFVTSLKILKANHEPVKKKQIERQQESWG